MGAYPLQANWEGGIEMGRGAPPTGLSPEEFNAFREKINAIWAEVPDNSGCIIPCFMCCPCSKVSKHTNGCEIEYRKQDQFMREWSSNTRSATWKRLRYGKWKDQITIEMF